MTMLLLVQQKRVIRTLGSCLSQSGTTGKQGATNSLKSWNDDCHRREQEIIDVHFHDRLIVVGKMHVTMPYMDSMGIPNNTKAAAENHAIKCGSALQGVSRAEKCIVDEMLVRAKLCSHDRGKGTAETS